MTKTALIVVDLVRDFTHPEGAIFYESTGKMMPTVCSFIDEVRDRGVSIIYIQNIVDANQINPNKISKKLSCLKGSGGELLDERLPIKKGDLIVPKKRFSAFFKTELEELLQKRKIEKVIIIGTKTNCCIRATAIDAQMRDYDTYIVSDCVSTNTQELNEFHLQDLAKYTATVLSSKEILDKMDKDEW